MANTIREAHPGETPDSEINGPIAMPERVISPRSKRLRAGGELSQIEVLSRGQFLRRLEFEKRRTDRSKAALSLVLFRVDDQEPTRGDRVADLVHLVGRTKRETDIIGNLGDGLVGLILTDTDRAALEVFTNRVAEKAVFVDYSVTSGTYPDQLFDSLGSDTENQPDALAYLLGAEAEQRAVQRALKRCIDVMGAVALIAIASPIMLIAAIAVKATSSGPIIYSQQRLGRRAVPFTFYKFRSMKADADDTVHREYVSRLIEGRHSEVNHGDQNNPIYKLQGDTRITRVGAFLRRTSIDELPQLFNVLKGDMSLVGPRPPLVYEAERYQSWHLRRVLECRPGMTGLWQVEGRNRVEFDEMVRLDLRYIRGWSLWLDLTILIKTALVVLRSQGDR